LVGIRGLGFGLHFCTPHLPLQTKIPIPLFFGCHTYFSKAPLKKRYPYEELHLEKSECHKEKYSHVTI